jgi:GNAT superfamily N-acetyltransferase
MRIRPLRPEDVDAAREAAYAAMPPPDTDSPEEAERYWAARFERFVGTQPGGCWCAEDDDGRIVGTALAHVRDGIWGLAFFAVAPGVQARGVGRQILDATLTHAEDARAAIIASSTDPKAMRLYARAGFDLRPCVAAAGIVDRGAIPKGLRSIQAQADALELVVPLGREVRGGAYAPEDLAIYLTDGAVVLRHGDDGVAVARDGTPKLLLARDDAIAQDLLWACLASGPNGGTVEVDYLIAGQDWAIRVALDAGLPLSPAGPLFTRGELGPLRPWIPSGAFL